MIKYLIFLLITSGSLFCQNINSPEELIQKCLSREVIKDISDDYCCEMLEYYKDQPNFGSQIPNDIKISYRKLEENRDHSVYSILLEDTLHPADYYFYLNNENGWKLEAVRALTLPGFVYMLLDSLKAMNHIPDSLKTFYNQMEIATKTDSHLKEYLKENIGGFESLLNIISSHPEIEFINNSGNYSPPNLDQQLRTQIKLELNNLSIDCIKRDEQYNGITFFIIFGMIDNEVGFFYADKNAVLPKISSHRYIYIEKISDNWYIYKTT